MKAPNSARVSPPKRKRLIHDDSRGNRHSKAARASPSQSVTRNYLNFTESAPPRRVMFFDNGDWCDFAADSIAVMADAFRHQRSVVEISLRDCEYLVDFVGMVMIDVKSCVHRSVAWIDEAGKCFFPSVFCGGDDIGGGVNLELDVKISKPNGLENGAHREVVMNSESEDEGACSRIKEVVVENGVRKNEIRVGGFGFGSLGDNLVRLERGSEDFESVKKVFLEGLGELDSDSIVLGIHRYVPMDCAALQRSQSFVEQVEVVDGYRGGANVRRGWYGSSKEGVVGILRRGFGSCVKPSEGVAYGAGVQLAPEDCSHTSVKLCDADENGVQHMVLCRIIMGSMEEVQPGSELFHPSCEDFDSGVDSIQNPRLYVIRSTNVNTHILPEYVVSFKLISEQGNVASLKSIEGKIGVAVADNQQMATVVDPFMA